MNLETGEVLSRAWPIIWKQKVSWAMSLLPFLISKLFLPIWLILVFQRDFYVGIGLLTSLVLFPFMTRKLDASMDFNHMLRLQTVFGMFVLPVMIVIQSFSLAYIRSVMMLFYLRLTRHTQPQPVLQEATI